MNVVLFGPIEREFIKDFYATKEVMSLSRPDKNGHTQYVIRVVTK